jgi:hypothetical protein
LHGVDCFRFAQILCGRCLHYEIRLILLIFM